MSCWYCQKNTEPLMFCFEFDTPVHLLCLVAAMKRDRHQETMLIFNELLMNDGDVLLKDGERCGDGCFQLGDDGNWHEIHEIEGRCVLPGEIVCRQNPETVR